MEILALTIQIYLSLLIVCWGVILYLIFVKGNKSKGYNGFENTFYSLIVSIIWPYVVFITLKERVFSKEARAKIQANRLVKQAEQRAKQHSKETDRAIEFRKKNNPTIDDEVEKMRKEIYK